MLDGFATGSRVTGVVTNPAKTTTFGHAYTNFDGADLDVTLVTGRRMTRQEVFDMSSAFRKQFGVKLGVRNVVDPRQLQHIPNYGQIKF
jgi:hypothetical protein